MPHPLVMQLWFTRSQFRRGLAGVTVAEAHQPFLTMNSISWIVASHTVLPVVVATAAPLMGSAAVRV